MIMESAGRSVSVQKMVVIAHLWLPQLFDKNSPL
jgi:hypothetical protein